jgi:PQQ-like domain
LRLKLAVLLSLIPLLGLSACPTGHPPDTGTAPAITAQPSNQTVTAPATATFSVSATGTTPLTYTWESAASGSASFAAIAGAPNSSGYTTPATSTGQSGTQFRVVVSNGVSPAATSNAATLTVNAAAGTAPSITAQPTNQTVTAGGTATFTVTATGTAPLSYQWQSAPSGSSTYANVGSASATPSLAVANTTVGMSGSTYRVVVSNGVNPAATSNAATLTVNPVVAGTVRVLTYHNDAGRTGLNASESVLTTVNVNQSTFGKLGSVSVSGLVDAEPLYVPGLTISGAMHNVLYVATENDRVYAFDADTLGAALWNVSVAPSGESFSDDRSCNQVEPNIGVTSTPVIDLSAGPNGTIFVVAMTKDTGGNYHQRLHALDLTTGSDLMAATDIQATASGSGTGSNGGVQTFNPASYEERAALLLVNGVIYTTWTSHCDAPDYTSWVIGFNESNLQRVSVLNLTANGTTQGGLEGGIWMAGDGPGADSAGNVYVLIGNGTFDTTLTGGFPNESDFGNSFMKLTASGSSLTVADYFAMNNSQGTAETESSADTDLGSGGLVVLPDITDNSNTVHHLAVGAGKDTNMYVVNRDSMGKFTSGDSGIYQELSGVLSGGVWSAPAYFNHTIYYGSVDNNLQAYSISSVNAKLSTSATSESPETFGYPGTTPSVSANGTTNGIVWAIENGSTGVLHAFDATDVNTELYNSNQAGGRDTFSTNSDCKFVTPMIANGKVYVGTPGAVVVFGLINQSAKAVRARKTHPADARLRHLPAARAPHPGSSTPGY